MPSDDDDEEDDGFGEDRNGDEEENDGRHSRMLQEITGLPSDAFEGSIEPPNYHISDKFVCIWNYVQGTSAYMNTTFIYVFFIVFQFTMIFGVWRKCFLLFGGS